MLGSIWSMDPLVRQLQKSEFDIFVKDPCLSFVAGQQIAPLVEAQKKVLATGSNPRKLYCMGDEREYATQWMRIQTMIIAQSQNMSIEPLFEYIFRYIALSNPGLFNTFSNPNAPISTLSFSATIEATLWMFGYLVC